LSFAHFVQFLDIAKRLGYAATTRIRMASKKPPKLAAIGENPGGKPIEDAPLVVLRIADDTPPEAIERIQNVLRGWGITRIRIESIPTPKKK
jgi:hypothetical protein